jgi:hypothetical protein
MPAKKTDPQMLTLPDRLMAVVRTVGDPNTCAEEAMKALFGAVYTLKFARKKSGGGDFKVEALRARWPDAHLKSKDQWTAIWAIPIPDDTTELVQKVPGIEVTIERWAYGLVAQVLYVGSYADEGPTIQRLHDFIAAQGYVFAGPHEEEYLTRPTAKEPKTIIRMQVQHP